MFSPLIATAADVLRVCCYEASSEAFFVTLPTTDVKVALDANTINAVLQASGLNLT